MDHEDRWFRESIADTDVDAWHDPRGPVKDDGDLSHVAANLNLWVDQAIDARVRAEAEGLDLLSEEAIKLLLRRP